MTIVIDGELGFEVDGDVRLLMPGMVLVISPKEPHGARSLEIAWPAPRGATG